MKLNVRLRMLLWNNKVFGSLIIFCIILIASLFVALIMLGKDVTSNLNKTYELKEKSDAFNLKIKNDNNSVFEQKMLGAFTNEQLATISQKYFTYELRINGEILNTGKNEVFSKTKDIKVVLIEKNNDKTKDILPEKIMKFGRKISTENADNILKISTNKAKKESKISNKGNDDWLEISFSNVFAGEIITIDIDKQIATKLGLKNNVIEIIYNETK